MSAGSRIKECNCRIEVIVEAGIERRCWSASSTEVMQEARAIVEGVTELEESVWYYT